MDTTVYSHDDVSNVMALGTARGVSAITLTYGLMVVGFTAVTGSRVVLPLAALKLGASPSSVGLVLSAFYVIPLGFAWKIGIHGDRRGSRPLLTIGSACGGVAMLLPVALSGSSALYLAAVLMGFAFTCYNVLLQNLIGILSSPHDRARKFGNAAMAGGVSNLVGPLVSGWAIDRLGLDAAWIILAVMSFGCTFTVLMAGGALPGPTTTTASQTRLRDTLAGEGIARILVISSLVQVGQDLFQFYIPVYGNMIGASASLIGLAIGAYGAATFAARFAMPTLVARFGEAWLLVGAFTLATLGFCAIPLTHNAGTLAIVAVVFGLGMGCGQPVTTMMMFARSPAGRSGEALGVRQTFNNLVRVGAPALFGALAAAIGLVPVLLASGLMMSAGAWLMRPKRDRSQTRDDTRT